MDPSLRFDIVEENFPQPLGKTTAGLAEATARFERLSPGGRLKLRTENPDVLERYGDVAKMRGMAYTLEEVPASRVELPPTDKEMLRRSIRQSFIPRRISRTGSRCQSLFSTERKSRRKSSVSSL